MSELRSVGKTELTPKEWLERESALRTLRMKEILLISLLILYALVLVSTITIFFLQGFRVCGFNLDMSLLKWLGGATVGEVAGLITLTVTYYLKSS